MIIFPAIDLKDGKCVRLYKGDFSKTTIFNASPYNQAVQFKKKGFTDLHLVDLDGALKGKSKNKEGDDKKGNAKQKENHQLFDCFLVPAKKNYC